MTRLRRLLAAARSRLRPSGSVGERAANSVVWAFLANGLGRGLQLAKLLVLANFLSQAAFGLVGVALLLLVGVRRFSNLGIDEALIQHPDADVDDYLATAWVVRAVRGLLTAGLVFAAAPLVAAFFVAPARQPLLTAVVRAMALVPLLRGLQNPGAVYLRKELAFHREFGYRVGTAAADVSVAVAAVIALGSVWALVYGTLAGAATRLGLSYLVHPSRPGLGFDRARARELLGFGKWVTGSGIAAFLTTEGDDAFVGWFLGVGALGLYQTAYRFSNAPATEISQVVSSVVFPTYAKLQDDEDALESAYLRTVQLTTFLAFPAAVGIAAVAPVFVDAFINNEQGWDLALLAVTMQALAAWGLLRAIGATTGPLFRAVGRPDYETKIQLAKLAVIAVAIYPLTAAFGLLGTAAAVVGASLFVAEPVATGLAVRTAGADYRAFLGLLAYPALGSAAMGVCVVAVARSVQLSPLVELPVLVTAGLVTYAGAVLVLSRLGYDVLSSLRQAATAATADATG
ncbi:lipopolysaccharide biosynthesis protein [Haloglomus halophilum]|uniref:lipopolysaccharide biosynthesis protein n=1 Tax=Haloglomus halophilum TaxID=2962672 RepID=UPI0020CA09CA|nr:lipopolysaccharide biosynthesis protein [Haloglomus halophilum]